MEIVISGGLAIVLFVVSVIVKLIAGDLCDCVPFIAKWIIKKAANRLPEEQRSEKYEEWCADLEEWPGKAPKLLRALRILYGSRKTALELSGKRSHRRRKLSAKNSETVLGAAFASLAALAFAFTAVHVPLALNGGVAISLLRKLQRPFSRDLGYADTYSGSLGYYDTGSSYTPQSSIRETPHKVPLEKKHSGSRASSYDLGGGSYYLGSYDLGGGYYADYGGKPAYDAGGTYSGTASDNGRHSTSWDTPGKVPAGKKQDGHVRTYNHGAAPVQMTALDRYDSTYSPSYDSTYTMGYDYSSSGRPL